MREDWKQFAACLGQEPDWWFPSNKWQERQALQICASCDVKVECFKYARDNRERMGIFGGHNFERSYPRTEEQKLRRQQRRTAAS